MGRKNNSVRRTNAKGRLPRRQRGEGRMPSEAAKIMRPDISEMVMPDGQCVFMNPRRPKARFATEAKAGEALRQAQSLRARTGSGHVEKRYYACPEGGCGGFHLTSREAFDDDIRRFREEQYHQQTRNTRLAQIREESA